MVDEESSRISRYFFCVYTFKVNGLDFIFIKMIILKKNSNQQLMILGRICTQFCTTITCQGSGQGDSVVCLEHVKAARINPPGFVLVGLYVKLVRLVNML